MDVRVWQQGKRALLSGITSINVTEPSIMSIDGSTTTTGIAIMGIKDSSVLYTLSARHQSKETQVEYKTELKRVLKAIWESNPLITHIIYELPYIGYMTAISGLFLMKPMVEEVIAEYKPQFDYLQHDLVNNMRWKKHFFAPRSVPIGTENVKPAIQALVRKLYGVGAITQDECDAIGMGRVYCAHCRGEIQLKETKKKYAPFIYTIDFVPAPTISEVCVQLSEMDIPKRAAENGIYMTDYKCKRSFDQDIYDAMAGEDVILVMLFTGKTAGNVVLRYRLASMMDEYGRLAAVVWRKNRIAGI